MKQPIFNLIPLKKPSFIQRLLKQAPVENAIIEINNLFATKAIDEITKNEIKLISKKYQINLFDDFSLNMEEFYAVVFNYSLRNKKISEKEVSDLEHIKSILDLDEKKVMNISLLIGKDIYKDKFEELIANGRLTEKGKKDLYELGNTLTLSKDITQEIGRYVKTNYFEKFCESILLRNRVTPSEEIEIFEIAKNFDIVISENLIATIQTLKNYWSFENLELNTVFTNHKLQKNENAYFIANDALWFEERESLKKSYNYSKINSQNEVMSQNLKFIDKGTIILTGKRLLFVGIEKTSSIHIEKIISIYEYKNGIEIDKISGRNPLFKVSNDTTVFSIILNRLIKEIY